ncbi:MAG: hypothetical protein HUU38_11390 [Anaerolineales bacterium]|nr:hypothetical protein [Anaerolineales bacterium]
MLGHPVAERRDQSSALLDREPGTAVGLVSHADGPRERIPRVEVPHRVEVERPPHEVQPALLVEGHRARSPEDVRPLVASLVDKKFIEQVEEDGIVYYQVNLGGQKSKPITTPRKSPLDGLGE